MAIAEGKPRTRNRAGDFALEVFGQSIRESNCDCDRSDAPSLLQSIYLRNDADMHRRLADKDGWVAQACEALGVDGPKSAADPRQIALQRKADGMRKQFVNRVREFHKQPEARQQRLLPQLERDYARTSQRLKQYGYAVPPLKRLIADSEAWNQLESKTKAGPATSTINRLVQDAYLRTLSRYPDDEEAEISASFIQESKSPAEGVQSLLWALVNTKEFIITH
jgi:hypothetical protein